MSTLHQGPLGKPTHYRDKYSPELLFTLERKFKRHEIGIDNHLPFTGVDIWNAYEVSWLNLKGKPQVASLTLKVPCETPCIFESKSLKLYLNSFNQSKFTSAEEVRHAIQNDLSLAIGGEVQVILILPEQFPHQKITELPGYCIDNLDIETTRYQPDASLLNTETANTNETLVSHLLKSNCLITSQPDWASIMIEYSGKKINHGNLLQYLISFRQHNEFHEQCVERIFKDILEQCQPTELTVYARYTRRGGIDINPYRTNTNKLAENWRNFRQ